MSVVALTPLFYTPVATVGEHPWPKMPTRPAVCFGLGNPPLDVTRLARPCMRCMWDVVVKPLSTGTARTGPVGLQSLGQTGLGFTQNSSFHEFGDQNASQRCPSGLNLLDPTDLCILTPLYESEMIAMDLALRLLHIIPAIFLAGGVFFMWAALVPALATVSKETSEALLSTVRGRWSKVVMACTVLLLVSGIWNAVSNIRAYQFDGLPGKYYHALVLIKLILALAIFFLTAVIGGRSSLADKFRDRLPFWMAVNTGLLLALIVVASSMKISQREPKPDQTTAAVVWSAATCRPFPFQTEVDKRFFSTPSPLKMEAMTSHCIPEA